MFICGAGGLAIISVLQERWKWRHERKAKKEDRKEEREDKLDLLDTKLTKYIDEQQKFNERTTKEFEDNETQMAAQSEALKYILLDRIMYLGQEYIKDGEVSFDDRKRLRDMHTSYHKKLDGNGDADAVMKAVDNLPLKANN